MERKKSRKADLEWRKSTFFQLGIVISLALVLMAFEYVKSDKSFSFIGDSTIEIPDEIVIVPTTQNPELPKPKPAMLNTNFTTTNNDNPTFVDIIIDADPETEMPDDYVPVTDEPEIAPAVDDPFVPVEIMPEFPGGEQELMMFLKENIVYPKTARELNISGKVVVGFVVEADGSLSNIQVARSVFSELDEEAMRVVKKMPKWNPGKQRQKAVRVQFYLPVNFVLK
ncbi:MAG: TonB family protein [Bacteroidales bacterium]|jgi:protein TonB|nr:TonB family protein [Bacteroidales bacterium]